MGCAASRSPDPSRPRADEPPYPVILSADKDRSERALAVWATLMHAAAAPAPELQPVTATLRALPALPAGSLRLPLVEIKDGEKGSGEEAVRESLRRFISGATDLLGVTLENLSLVEIKDDAGARVARYRQRPFPYPLRGGYGRLEIRFAPDRTVLAVSSTTLPETERLRRALLALRPRLIPSEQVAARIVGRTLTVATAVAGATETHTVAAGEPLDVRQLVVYPRPRTSDPNAIELLVAWEVSVGGTGDLFAYVDAVTGEIIAADRAAQPVRA